jgi:hypothetical protein
MSEHWGPPAIESGPLPARKAIRPLPLAAALIFLLCACASHPPLSPVSAGALAAQLANERCRKDFGKRPFHPEDFEALLDQGRWHWGTLDGGKVDGYEAEVSFDRSGGKREVRVRVPEE